MARAHAPGQIVILNGTPRSGKSSIAAAIQETFHGVWMNLGVDGFMRMTPARFMPGMGLRPGGERPDLEPLVATLYGAVRVDRRPQPRGAERSGRRRPP
jgi:chloramphenicol 3-O phosphotransferase